MRTHLIGPAPTVNKFFLPPVSGSVSKERCQTTSLNQARKIFFNLFSQALEPLQKPLPEPSKQALKTGPITA
jgi:hypothetical protein